MSVDYNTCLTTSSYISNNPALSICMRDDEPFTVTLDYNEWFKKLGIKYQEKLPFKIVKVEELVPSKVVRCTFSDGDIQKAICCSEDTYTLEAGISISITKHLLGGTGMYNKAIKQGVKCYENEVKAKQEKDEEEERKKHRREKFEAYKKRRDEKKKEQYIKEQAEILARAIKLSKE